MKRIYNYILILSLVLISASCDNETPTAIINAPVDYLIYVKAWDSELATPGVVKTFPAGKNSGLGGLIALSNPHDIIAGNIYGLYVYDRACPYEKDKNSILTIGDDYKAHCEKCKSVFDLLNGNGGRLSGPSETGLQVYRAIYERDGVFRVIR